MQNFLTLGQPIQREKSRPQRSMSRRRRRERNKQWPLRSACNPMVSACTSLQPKKCVIQVLRDNLKTSFCLKFIGKLYRKAQRKSREWLCSAQLVHNMFQYYQFEDISILHDFKTFLGVDWVCASVCVTPLFSQKQIEFPEYSATLTKEPRNQSGYPRSHSLSSAQVIRIFPQILIIICII